MKRMPNHMRTWLWALVLSILWGCSGDPTGPEQAEHPDQTAFKPPPAGQTHLFIVPQELELHVGESFQLALDWNRYWGAEEPTGPVRWVSDDETIVTVTQDGVAEGKSRGTVFIRALHGDQNASAKVRVR
jgi:hypothetical protein